MKHWIFGTIILCLTLAASVVTAQDIDEEELKRQILDDIGVTQAELMQFIVNAAGIAEPYQQYIDESHGYDDPPTAENYVEVVGGYFDNIIQPLVADLRNEAINFFTEDQYARMTTRGYQVVENFPEACRANEIPMGDIVQLLLLPDIIPLTEEQISEIFAMQKEILIELAGIDIISQRDNAELYAERDALFKEFEKAENEEEKAAIRAKISEVDHKTSALMREPTQKAFDKMKTKLDSLLTPEQKAKLAQIKQDIPDYLKNAMAKMTKTDAASESEAPAAWRPGANSWMPGQGAPKDLDKSPREAPRVREPRERKFPGSE